MMVHTKLENAGGEVLSSGAHDDTRDMAVARVHDDVPLLAQQSCRLRHRTLHTNNGARIQVPGS